MSLSYVEKLRAQFKKVTENNDLPLDVVAMTELTQTLNSVSFYGGSSSSGMAYPLQLHSTRITNLISSIVDARIDRILRGLEAEAKAGGDDA